MMVYFIIQCLSVLLEVVGVWGFEDVKRVDGLAVVILHFIVLMRLAFKI